MKSILLFISLFLTVNMASASDAAAQKAAEKLLSIVGMEQVLEQSVDQMIAAHLQQNPAMAPYERVMKEFFRKYMSYESLKSDLVAIYAETFTAQELNELVAFYETPTGRKTITVMPSLMGKGAQIGANRVQSNIAELRDMITTESEKIKQQQGK